MSCTVCKGLRLHACIYLTSPLCVFDAASDVAGGYSASMLDAVRKALDSSKILTIQDPDHETLTFEEVFRLATLGGSQGKRQQRQQRSHCVEVTLKTSNVPSQSFSLQRFSVSELSPTAEMPDSAHKKLWEYIFIDDSLQFHRRLENTTVCYDVFRLQPCPWMTKQETLKWVKTLMP